MASSASPRTASLIRFEARDLPALGSSEVRARQPSGPEVDSVDMPDLLQSLD
jgi:hypothetical protein